MQLIIVDPQLREEGTVTAGKYAGAVRDVIKGDLFSYVHFFNIMSYDD